MAVVTTGGSGNWSSVVPNAPWPGGVAPVNGDSVVVAATHTLTVDQDLNALGIGLVGITITGTLETATAAGAYSLKMNSGTISGAGSWKAGSSGAALPSSASLKIYLAATAYVNLSGGLSVLLYCTQPAHPYVRLAANEAALQTDLTIDTDLTAETTDWYAGAPIVIADVDKGLDYQGVADDARTLTIVKNATEITISGTGLDSANIAGAYVLLATRNIEFLATGSAAVIQNGSASNPAVLRCSIRQTGALAVGSAISGGVGHTLSGVYTGFASPFSGGSNHALSGCAQGGRIVYLATGYTITGLVVGGSTGIEGGTGHNFSGTIAGCTAGVSGGTHRIGGTIYGCTTGVSVPVGCELSGTIQNCTSGIASGFCFGRGTQLVSNTADIATAVAMQGWGVALRSVAAPTGYGGGGPPHQTIIYDASDSSGVVRPQYVTGYMQGGRITTVTSGWTGRAAEYLAKVYKFALEDSGFPVWVDLLFSAEVNQQTQVIVHCQQDTTGLTQGFRAELRDSNAAWGATALATVSAADSTAWQALRVAYTATYARVLILRLSAQHGSGKVYAWPLIRIGGLWLAGYGPQRCVLRDGSAAGMRSPTELGRDSPVGFGPP